MKPGQKHDRLEWLVDEIVPFLLTSDSGSAKGPYRFGEAYSEYAGRTTSRTEATKIVREQLMKLGKRCEGVTGQPIDFCSLARIHAGGQDEWREIMTVPYWHKVHNMMLDADFKRQL